MLKLEAIKYTEKNEVDIIAFLKKDKSIVAHKSFEGIVFMREDGVEKVAKLGMYIIKINGKYIVRTKNEYLNIIREEM